jgi:hypothetical protein
MHGRSNCLVWAIGQRRRHGGRLRLVWLRRTWTVRALWIAPDGSIWRFAPRHPRAGKCIAWLHKWWFLGEPRCVRRAP